MTDTPLTDDGVLEAKTAGKLIKNEDVKFDVVYTSLLRRSIKTVWMVLQEIGDYLSYLTYSSYCSLLLSSPLLSTPLLLFPIHMMRINIIY